MADKLRKPLAPKDFFALGLQGAERMARVREVGLAYNTAVAAEEGDPVSRKVALALETWSLALPSATAAGVYIDAMLAVFPERVPAARTARRVAA